MKKYINPKTIPILVIIASLIGLGLRLWTMAGGVDAFGLYPDRPFAWVVLWLFTALVAAAVFLAIRPLRAVGSYAENYPKSIPGTVGSALAGVFFFISGCQQFGGEAVGVVGVITGIFGLLAGAALVVVALFRMNGKKPNFLLHGVACLYLALRLFNRCQIWSNEPQVGVFILPFLASLTVMLAAYQRTCFDVDMGKRKHYLFWSLLGTYFCVGATLSGQEVLFYLACALWMMTNLCSLRPIKRKKAPQPQQTEEQVEAPAEEAPPKADAPEQMTMEELEKWLETPDQQ